ncbi:MAG: glycosyl transferase, partial [Treponema sp.]|nr:glycosyl transferase [Treponema sp.]
VEEFSEVHRTEPYVYSQMIAGKEARNFGQAKNSWLTGTAAWNMVALSRYICGIRPDYSGLYIEPRLPSHVKKATIVRIFRGVKYTIDVDNRNNAGTVTLSCDNNATCNALVVTPNAGAKEVKVSVVVQ